MSRTIKITVKPEIDAHAIEEAARNAAAYFLTSFAAHIAGHAPDDDYPEDDAEPLADWERELIEASSDPALNPEGAQGYDLLRSALNAASIDARARTADHELVGLLLETPQGREVLRRLDRMSPATNHEDQP